MWLQRSNGASVSLSENHTLQVERIRGDGRTTEITIKITTFEPFSEVENTLNLDSWSPNGYLITPWADCGCFIIGGDGRLICVSNHRLESESAIILEWDECELIGTPYFVSDDSIMLIATEVRVCCLDRRRALRWCWSVRSMETGTAAVVRGVPTLDSSVARFMIESTTKTSEIALSLLDGARVELGRQAIRP